jgi:hypothetical protein
MTVTVDNGFLDALFRLVSVIVEQHQQLISLPQWNIGMSSTWRPAPQRLMKTEALAVCCVEACGPEVFGLTGA